MNKQCINDRQRGSYTRETPVPVKQHKKWDREIESSHGPRAICELCIKTYFITFLILLTYYFIYNFPF